DLILLVTPLVALLVVGAQLVALRAGSRPSRGALAGMGLAGLAGAVALALWRAPAGGASAVTVLPGLVVLATGAMAERSRWWRPALALALVGSVLLVALRAQEP
ncbi:MAG TPA: hypothetical protein VFX50_03790, partial [Gemmatimonadales bacterium]|nr:hypothetical protein [Gemmatimonadales bacterium]